MSYTHFDLKNAVIYANNRVLEQQYDTFLRQYPYIFKHVTVDSRPATHKDYYVPASIANKCKVYRLSFNETGCRKIGCFPKTQDYGDCTENDDARYIAIGGQHFLSCQPACHEISPTLDSEFRDGKCYAVNVDKKMFAMFPSNVYGDTIYQPLHNGLDFVNGDVAINENYCKAFGLAFEDGDCVAPIGQQIGEYFIGSTVYRSLNKLVIPVTNAAAVAPHAVPHDVANTTNWLEGSRRRKKRSVQQVVESKESVSLLKELVQDVTIDFGTDVIIATLKKRIPNALVNFSNTLIDRQIVRTALAQTILRSQTLAVVNASRSAMAAVSVANITLAVVGVVTMCIDLWDPFNFTRVIDKRLVDAINNEYDFRFFSTHRKDVEITPAHVWNLLESDMSEYNTSLIENIIEYLDAVVTEDADERYKVQIQNYKRERSTTMNWDKILHVTFVAILIVLSVLFIQYIAYFILMYFIFVVVWPSFLY